ncbi:antitoxin MazE family protein [Telmatospirillum sp. J64-1]|uniref:antitoxin MazE family protein n=1 Tax=Telmatospirillum sp. J64-1 TaxID=2502183 RepID=UPI00115F171C|nr:antitoxin MazE family protein [Telmatospirillum sp. J64-1]
MASSVARRVKHHRESLRAAGLRPLQIWVPDTRRPGFAEECRRQSRSLRDDPHERETLEWLEDAADSEDWQ